LTLTGFIDKPIGESFNKYHHLTSSILRAFSFGDSCVMENRINREVRSFVAELARCLSKPVDPLPIVAGSVVNVISSVLFGRHFDWDDPELAELIRYNHRFSLEMRRTVPVNLFPVARFLPSMRRHIANFKETNRWLLEFADRQIDETLASNDDDDSKSFIRSFVNAERRRSFDRTELLFILRDLLVAGSETSTATVMWAIALFADHRDVQARLHDEIDAVVGGRGVDDSRLGIGRRRLPSLADRSRMPYVEATILEVMRYKTITPLSLPRETVRETRLDGYTVPAGSMVGN
jgi:cytochrome P450